jgi:(S)-2-hydroxy-acid oxidase
MLYFRFANFEDYASQGLNLTKTGSGLTEYIAALFDASLSWDDVKWLKRLTNIIAYEFFLS